MTAHAPPPTLFVVDDDQGLLILIEDALRAEKWNVATATSGADALAWLQNNSADLLLLDLKLGDIEGREFIGTLADAGLSVPFIVITGQSDVRVAVEMMKRGALDYLVKDVNFLEFVPTIVRRGLEQLERARQLVGAETSLRESAEHYRLLAEMAGTVVLLLGKDGTILEWSGAAERVCGYTAAEVTGKNYLELFLTDTERPGVAKELEKIFTGIPTVGYENLVVTRAGATPTFLWNAALLSNDLGQPLGALSVGHDITKRKHAEESLRKSEERLRAFLDNSAVIGWMKDKEGRYVFLSDNYQKRLGVRFKDWKGKTDSELWPREFAERLRRHDLAVLKADRSIEVIEQAPNPDGSVSWWLNSKFSFLDENGDRYVGGLGVDISERRLLEEQLLHISEREQRKFGHDLHDGLGQRLTGLEMLSHGLAEDLKAHSPDLAKQARRLNRELRETVTQARLISHSLAPVPREGDGLMRGLMELAASTNRIPGVACRFTCDPPVCIQDVTTATHLYRIAQEAVNNALKHGPAKKIDITLTERAEGLELSVENNGPAIPPANRANSGMGLNVMRYRAEMIGASLSIESGKRKGVRVTCTLGRKI